jgi:thiol-disulfide isomerase/thioredoxin
MALSPPRAARIAVISTVIVVATFAGLAVWGDDGDDEPVADLELTDGEISLDGTPPQVEAPADASALFARSFTTFDGTTTSLADWRGTPVVVNLWASWCTACIDEMPAFEQVHQALDGRVAVLGVNIDDPSAEGAARELARATGVTYPLAFDPEGWFAAELGALVMPTTAFVAADGTVVEVHSGALTADDLTAAITEAFG